MCGKGKEKKKRGRKNLCISVACQSSRSLLDYTKIKYYSI